MLRYDRGGHAELDTTLCNVMVDGSGRAVGILSCSLDHSGGELTELSAGSRSITDCQTNVGKKDSRLLCVLCCVVVSNEEL